MSLIIKEYVDKNESSVVGLWKAAGLISSTNDPRKDIARKLRVNPDLFLVGWHKEELVATVMGGYEGHRGWINYLAVAPEIQKNGFGLLMMKSIEERLLSKGCPKINLQVRTSNQSVIDFYQAIGYVQDDVISLGKRLVLDN